MARFVSEAGETLGVLGIHVDDILMAGDESRPEWLSLFVGCMVRTSGLPGRRIILLIAGWASSSCLMTP